MKRVAICDGKVYIEDDRWITVNADKETGQKGQHVLIKENGDIVLGLGGKFKNLRDLGKKTDEEIIKNSPALKELVDRIKSPYGSAFTSYKVDYNPVKKQERELTEREIIDIVGGGDRTEGSCFSAALAYIGQKGGLNVLDFRGGDSQEYFSSFWQNVYNLAGRENYTYIYGNKTSLGIGKKLLKQIEDGKQYLMTVGKHATIVRNIGGKLAYLELQNDGGNGWVTLNAGALERRFGCRPYRRKFLGSFLEPEDGALIDIDKLKNLKEFRVALGYLNTQNEKQKKGHGGHRK